MSHVRSERRLVTDPLPDWAEELLNSTIPATCTSAFAATRGAQASDTIDPPERDDGVTRAELLVLEQRMLESMRAVEQRLEVATQSHLSRVLLGLDASRRAALRYS